MAYKTCVCHNVAIATAHSKAMFVIASFIFCFVFVLDFVFSSGC